MLALLCIAIFPASVRAGYDYRVVDVRAATHVAAPGQLISVEVDITSLWNATGSLPPSFSTEIYVDTNTLTGKLLVVPLSGSVQRRLAQDPSRET